MSRSTFMRGVRLATIALCPSHALAQQSLPTIDVGGARTRPRPAPETSARPSTIAPGRPQTASNGAPTRFRDPAPDFPGQAILRLGEKELDYIRLSAQGDLNQTLKFSPGVSVSTLNTPNEPIISIRGSGANPTARPGNFRNFAIRDIVLLSDGFPITTADGFGRTQTLDPHSFAGIDVYRGASSALFGNYGLYGAINFNSFSGAQLDGGEIGSEGGGFGYVKNYVKVGKKFSTSPGDFDISVFGSDVRNDGYLAHSESQAQTANVLATWSPTPSDHFTLKYMFNNTFANVPGALSVSQFYLNPYQKNYGCPIAVFLDSSNIFCSSRTAPTNGVWGLAQPTLPQTDPRANRRQSFEALGIHAHNLRNIGGLRYEHDFDNGALARTQFTYDYRDVLSGAQPPPIGGFGGPLSFYGPTIAIDARVDLSARSTIFGRAASHFIGFIYNNAKTNFATFANIPNSWSYGARGGQAGKISSYTSNIALRAREEIELTNELTAAIAFSANWNRVWGNSLYNNYTNPPPGQIWNIRLTTPYDIAVDNAYFNTAPEASLSYRHNPEWTLRARYAVGYSTPSFDSLTASPTGAAQANKALKAQTSMEAEGGVDWVPDKTLSLSATFFNGWFRNELQSQVSPYDNSINFMQNIPATIHRGVEIGMDWKPIDGWRFFSAYTFSDFFFTNFRDQLARNAIYDRAGNYLPNQPAHTLTARVGYDAPHGDFAGLGAFVEYNFRSASTMDNANFTWIPGYGLVNLNLHYERDVNIGWIKSVSGYVEGRNMLDTVYAASAMPFTNPVNAVGVQLPAPLLVTSGTIMPGAPRAVVAGLKVKF